MGQGRLALQVIVDPQVQLGGRESKVKRVSKAIPASKARKVRLVRKGFQGFLDFLESQERLSSSPVCLERMGETVALETPDLGGRTVKQPSLGPRDVRGRPAQKATPGVQPKQVLQGRPVPLVAQAPKGTPGALLSRDLQGRQASRALLDLSD